MSIAERNLQNDSYLHHSTTPFCTPLHYYYYYYNTPTNPKINPNPLLSGPVLFLLFVFVAGCMGQIRSLAGINFRLYYNISMCTICCYSTSSSAPLVTMINFKNILFIEIVYSSPSFSDSCNNATVASFVLPLYLSKVQQPHQTSP